MAWVVKRWRTEGLERLLSDDALASAEAVRSAADRDARRARRTADRAAAEAAAELDALERLGAELRALVRRRRVSDAGGAAWERAAPSVGGPARLLLAAAAVARAASDPRAAGADARPPAPVAPSVDARAVASAPSAPPVDAPPDASALSTPPVDAQPEPAAPSTPLVDARPDASAPSTPLVAGAAARPPAEGAAPPADPLGAVTAPSPRRRSGGRASMRSSPLGELFRATTVR